MGRISVKNLGKAYKQYPSRFGRLIEWISPISITKHNLKWVLKDINFEVEPGEAVGIIGVNGAGKSTLLKMITGTTQPTCGSIQMTGSVAALLELGMGFHPDFTGRQNVFMAGQLLGMKAQTISEKFTEIEEFAEIGAAIDIPVRAYSSGMQVRLAFSVATAVRPDILIVDEALSVGDAYFQHKSFNRIKEYQKQGTTLLLVSHDKAAITAVCNRALLLNNGKVEMQGEPSEVMDYYNALLAERHAENVIQVVKNGVKKTISGNGKARLSTIAIKDANGGLLEIVKVGQKVFLEASVKAYTTIDRLVFGFSIRNVNGVEVFGINSDLKGCPVENVQEGEVVVFRFGFDANFGVGNYSISTALHSLHTHLSENYEWQDLAHIFQVLNTEKSNFVGCSWLDTELTIQRGN